MSLHRVLLDVLDDSIGGEDWIDDAICAQLDPDVFFGVDGLGLGQAKRICNTLCSVREQCLDWAMRVEGGQERAMRHGVYGGASANQRAKMDKRVEEPVVEKPAREPRKWVTEEQKALVRELRAQDVSFRDIAERVGISRTHAKTIVDEGVAA